MRGWVRCAPAFSERRERLAENRVCSRLHSPQRLRAVAAVSANHVFAAQKWFDYPSRTKQKQTIKKMELIKTIRTRVGTLRLAELRPLMRFPQFVACSRLHGRKKFLFPPFRRTMFLLRKNGSIIHPPKQKQTIKKMVCFCLVGEGGFGPPKLKSNRFTVCPLWPLGNSPIMELVMGLEPATC